MLIYINFAARKYKRLLTTLIHRINIKAWISSTICLCILWTGCGKQRQISDGQSVFRMNLPEGLGTLDPAFARSRAPIWMTAQLFNGLVALDSALEVVPAIAKKWEVSPDARTYTFHLRTDVWFHEHAAFGSPKTRKVIASDFAYSFTRICDPKTGSTGKWVFADRIAGINEYLEGSQPSISGFRTLNDSTFEVTLSRPFPALLGLLAMPYAYVVPQEVISHLGTDFQASPIGTGPFQFFRWEEGNVLILHRNPRYFERRAGKQLPYLDAVRVSFLPSLLSAFISLTQGDLDFIGDLDVSYKDEVLSYDGHIKPPYDTAFQVILKPQLNTEYLGFQLDDTVSLMQDHPLQNVKVRQAINYAIDREQLVRYLLNGMGYPAHNGFIPKGMPGFSDTVIGYKFDPKKANELMKEAGYPNGKRFPPLTLYSTSKYQPIMIFVQKSLERLGIKVDIQYLQSGALRKEIYGGRTRFWRASWIADYPEGENYMSLFWGDNLAPSGPNTTRFHNLQVDQWYAQALKDTSATQRQLLYQQIDQLVMEEAAIVPLYYDRSFRMLANGWIGLGSNPMNHLFLKEVQWVGVLPNGK